MTSLTLNPPLVEKRTTVHSVRFGYARVDPNGGTSNVSLTMTMKLESISPMQVASPVVALLQSSRQ